MLTVPMARNPPPTPLVEVFSAMSELSIVAVPVTKIAPPLSKDWLTKMAPERADWAGSSGYLSGYLQSLAKQVGSSGKKKAHGRAPLYRVRSGSPSSGWTASRWLLPG